MFDITTFLIRWFFLSNLARDVAELQTLPAQPFIHHQSAFPYHLPKHQQEEIWRDHCIRGILSYPPGTQRLMVMDALRVELVQHLHRTLKDSENTMSQLQLTKTQEGGAPHANPSKTGAHKDDPFLDADTEILRHFGEDFSSDDDTSKAPSVSSQRQAKLILSRDSTKVMDDDLSGDETNGSRSDIMDPVKANAPTVVTPRLPPQAQVQRAICCMRDIRDYLPQIVAAVLKSPPAFTPGLADPVQKLRMLILHLCQVDPSWGVELCWLLEAEVGRAWKTLFEHRQQTGRRLIVVLPAEKAAVLAKIGTERREAFDLLQDAEQATAYGYNPMGPDKENPDGDTPDEVIGHPQLPSSLSLRRCSHFGDAMHFIDRLTKISLDLRKLPLSQREMFLQQSLLDLNRRLRRRMVTRADISLDVEDHRGPHEWPQLEDLSADMLHYSVYFPLVPQTGTWPDGKESGRRAQEETPEKLLKAVRCLNIVVPETRILASRERCPYLIQLEVADTELESGDARLYASGATALGSTLEEALGMSTAASSAAVSQRHDPQNYEIPFELLSSRGGWQHDETPSFFYPNNDNENLSIDPYKADAYDHFRQHEYEQLHQQMQSEAPQHQIERGPGHSSISSGLQLLEEVFGQPWAQKCREIRDTSPYGHVKGWRLASFIMKAGEDIRREAVVMQVISKLRSWFDVEIAEDHRPYMRPYTIMCVGGDSGMLECLSDAKSIDEVKKKISHFTSLRDYFERAYGLPVQGPRGFGPPTHHSGPTGPEGVISFETAQDNFLRSLVGYSLVCYILQIKDRHNANILLDREGHIMHIDFGFVLGDTPKMGKVPIFSERAPFKLSQEFWEVLGGWNTSAGGLGVRFCKMFELAFESASTHADEIATLVEASVLSINSNPNYARSVANAVRSRLRMRGEPRSTEQKRFVMDLVNAALTCWSTTTYDWLQKSMNGYL
jgi:phosphatidylinositol 4-kinase